MAAHYLLSGVSTKKVLHCIAPQPGFGQIKAAPVREKSRLSLALHLLFGEVEYTARFGLRSVLHRSHAS